MAEQAFTTDRLTGWGGQSHLLTWKRLRVGDVGTACHLLGTADRCAQVTGSFGVGGAVVLEGSLDGVVYAPLTEPGGLRWHVQAPRLASITEATVWMRPRVVSGDPQTEVTVQLLVRVARV